MAVKNPYGEGELLTAAEVAELLPDTSAQTVLRWARQGALAFVKLPSGRKYFRRADIEALLTPVVASAASAGSADAAGPVEMPGQGRLWSAAMSSPAGGGDPS
ncbi:helix-turn-helix domain-containing protein [Actinomyces oricola]|uniref:helix-turn-helix domain-containing protein n=1 Tax=Actinomyces oricola TaxID=206043 RepID=UPI0013E8E559